MTSRVVLEMTSMESLVCGNDHAVSYRRLALACLLSMMVHVLVLATLSPVPKAPGSAALPSLQARLVARDRDSLTPPETASGEPVSSAISVPKVASSRASRRERSRDQSADAEKSRNSMPGASSVPTQMERPRSSKLASPGAHGASAITSVAATGRSAGFSYVEMQFELFAGDDRSSATTGRAIYSASDAHYGIVVQLAPAGAALLEDDPASLSVSGVITPQGLSPEVFDARGHLASNMLFLKSSSEITAEGGDRPRSGRFRDGLLDRQSLLYHFSLQPPNPRGGKILLSDGKTYAAYSYRVEPGGTETLPPLGEIRVTRISLQPEGVSTSDGVRIELYLVPEMGYLPIRVRHTDHNGYITEQRVTNLVYR